MKRQICRHVCIAGAFFLLVVGIAYLNYIPHTYLSGFDTLQTEFSPTLHILQDIFAVWQEYQGVGLLGGMGHASDLIHALLIFILNIILPNFLVRFIFTFFMIFLGTYGAFVFIFIITNRRHIFLACIGALFYLCNLATIQTFFTPLEVFSINFAALPWLFTVAVLYFCFPTKKNFLFFVGVNILATPIAYVQTVFFVYIGTLLLLFFVLLLFYNTKQHLFFFGKMLLVVFFINAFWLLPFFYFFITHSHMVIDAKMNQMSTQAIFEENKAFGNFWNTVLLQGFWFDTVDPNTSGHFTYMMGIWREWIANTPVMLLGFSFFGVLLLGVYKSIQSKNPFALACGVILLIFFTLLTTNTPPFSWIDWTLRTYVPFFKEAYRFAFTKFSTTIALFYALFFAIGAEHLISKLRRSNLLRIISYLLLITVPLIYVFPIFTGNLFYNKEHATIPKDYFSLFNFFARQDPHTRIADFPQYTYWGWNEYRWKGGNYGGSGFIWYGIQQPILDRTFDPWSSTNENYFWQIFHAVYSQNPNQIEQILNKYQVTWLIVDKNIFSPENPTLFSSPHLDFLFSQIPQLTKVQTFGNIQVYHMQLTNTPKDFVFLNSSLPTIHTPAWNIADKPFDTFGNYIIKADTASIWYPFGSLFSQKNVSDTEFSLLQHTSTIQLSVSKKSHSMQTLLIPSLSQKESQLPFSLTISLPQNTATENSSNPHISFTKTPTNTLSVFINKITNPYVSFSQTPLISTLIKNCDNFRKGTTSSGNDSSLLQLSATNATACFSDDIPFLPHELGYGLFITTKHVWGMPLHVWISANTINAPILDTYLPESVTATTYSFVLPPMEQYASGYAIHIENPSIGSDTTINDIGTITLYPIPYDFLTSLHTKGSSVQGSQQTNVPLSVTHPNPSLYIARFDKNSTQTLPTLILSQSYDPGWKAYEISNFQFPISNFFAIGFPFLFGRELTTHVKVNNWENGWILNNEIIEQQNTQTIILVYLPQYLEYVGFLLFALLLIYLIFGFFRNKCVIN